MPPNTRGTQLSPFHPSSRTQEEERKDSGEKKTRLHNQWSSVVQAWMTRKKQNWSPLSPHACISATPLTTPRRKVPWATKPLLGTQLRRWEPRSSSSRRDDDSARCCRACSREFGNLWDLFLFRLCHGAPRCRAWSHATPDPLDLPYPHLRQSLMMTLVRWFS